MSYRSFKHLLGETSLERKCRFIFGGGILMLVSFSFYWYGQKTESLVMDRQTSRTARLLVNPTVKDVHIRALGNANFETVFDSLSNDLMPLDDLPRYETHVYKAYPQPGAKPENPDDFERLALTSFVRAASAEDAYRKAGKLRKPWYFSDGSPTWKARIMPGKREYQYVQAVLFRPGCLIECHGSDGTHIDPHVYRPTAEGRYAQVNAGDLAGVVSILLPLDETKKEVHENRAMLITAALVTAILAMFASWTIVRYVIVKPLKHLRDVSDAIAAGKLNIRSQIQTGDEFEELSHAFNRMLHNLVAMQQELREVNSDLDRKVDELAQANMALFEMNRLKSDFLATMSHELRTPLNSIIGFSEVLSGSDQLNDRQRRYASNIQSSGKMLLSMINDILDLAKIESGKMEVRSEDFSVRDVCEALASLARPMAERKSIDLECRIDEAIPLLRQDAGKIRQILYNLLSNAIKFTPEGGRVTLRARTEGRFAILEVADTGIGIAEEDRDRIFEKFRQARAPGQPADDVLTREHQGTGLGLSIVRELARLLGGDVHLESAPGQGSTFTVRVPLQLPGNRKFEVSLSDERIDLSKARRVEARGPLPHLPLRAAAPEPVGPASGLGEPIRGSGRPH
ncbi:MAG: ATP-binding protein [Isosphaeraceae bacterium]|nr:ATP-binding protein [Isosphaeraceae bacterium]